MASDSFIISLKRQLLDSICGQWAEETLKLIRKHDKRLELGDFSFPSLNNEKVWGKLGLKTKCLKQIQDSSAFFKKISESAQTVVVYLDRKAVYEQYFSNTARFFLNNSDRKLKVQNFDKINPNSSELTSARANCISEVLVNLPTTTNKTVVISSTDLSSQIEVKVYLRSTWFVMTLF